MKHLIIIDGKIGERDVLEFRLNWQRKKYWILTKKFCLVLLFFLYFSSLEAKELLPLEFESVGVTEHVGVRVQEEAPFRNSLGQSVYLSQLIGQGKPTLLNFVYFNCPC